MADELAGHKAGGLFPAFPFGTDLTEIEITPGQTLQTLKTKLGSPGGAAKAAVWALEVRSVPAAALPYLERMALAAPGTLKEKMAQKLIVAELITEGHI